MKLGRAPATQMTFIRQVLRECKRLSGLMIAGGQGM
jgi:hypothetical protein